MVKIKVTKTSLLEVYEGRCAIVYIAYEKPVKVDGVDVLVSPVPAPAWELIGPKYATIVNYRVYLAENVGGRIAIWEKEGGDSGVVWEKFRKCFAEELAEIVVLLKGHDRLTWGDPFPWRIIRKLMLKALQVKPELSEKLQKAYDSPLLYVSRNNVIINPAFFYPLSLKAQIPYYEIERTAEELVWGKCSGLPLESYYACAERKIEFMWRTLMFVA